MEAEAGEGQPFLARITVVEDRVKILDRVRFQDPAICGQMSDPKLLNFGTSVQTIFRVVPCA